MLKLIPGSPLVAQGRLHAIASNESYITYSVYMEHPSPEAAIRNLNADDYAQTLSQIKARVQTYLRYYIYGAEFDYRPHSSKYGVDEDFSTSPRSIPLVQANELIDESIHLDAISLVYRYTFADEERSYRELWDKGVYASHQARGVGENPEDAFIDALRRALRETMRKKTFNKPRQITGRLVLNRMPREYVSQGRYVCELQIFIVQADIKPYEARFLQ